jgi:hypothetical protein
MKRSRCVVLLVSLFTAFLTACPTGSNTVPIGDTGPASDTEPPQEDVGADGSDSDASSSDASSSDASSADVSSDAPNDVDASAPGDPTLLETVHEVTTLGSDGVLIGHVVDLATNDPLVGATVTAEGQSATTDDQGMYRLEVSVGRTLVTVEMDGYVPWRGTESVTSTVVRDRISLAPAANEQMVDSGGATISADDASLAFPAGAFSGPQSVRATWLDGAEFAAVPGNRLALFDDATQTSESLAGFLWVDVSAEPSQPVEVVVPVPDGASPDDARLRELADDGSWGDPVQPVQTGPDTATFSVDHFSGHGTFYPDSGSTWIVRRAYKATSANGQPTTLYAGLRFDGTLDVSVDEDGSLTCVDPRGSEVTLSPQTTATFNKMDSDVAPGGGDVDLDRGRVKAKIQKLLEDYERPAFRIKHRTAVLGVRGTDFAVSLLDCSDTGRVAVAAGLVEMTLHDDVVPVHANEALDFCAGCEEGAISRCCSGRAASNGTVCSAELFCVDGYYRRECNDGECTCLTPRGEQSVGGVCPVEASDVVACGVPQ